MKEKIKPKILWYFISAINVVSFYPSSAIAQNASLYPSPEQVAKVRNGTADEVVWCEQGHSNQCNAAAEILVLQAQNDVFQAIRSANGVASNIVRHLGSASQPRNDVEAAAALYERSCSLIGSFGWEIGCEQLGWYYYTYQLLQVEAAQSLNLRPPDYPRALELFELACTVDHPYACEVAGGLHLNDNIPNIELNLSLALEFWDRGCRFDSVDTCWLLAEEYHFGISGQKDLSLARYYYRRACQLGYDFACIAVHELN